jgi:hypothetical protein
VLLVGQTNSPQNLGGGEFGRVAIFICDYRFKFALSGHLLDA